MKIKFILAVVFTALAVCLLSSIQTANAQQSGAQASSYVGPVTKVIFKNGYFEKNNQGGWDEYLLNDQLRFPFRETGKNSNSVFLRNDQLGVNIELNMATGEIWAEWPGKLRHMMHKITDVRNEAPEPPPAIPPMTPVTPPIFTSPGNSSGLAAHSILYSGGELKKSGEEWEDHRKNSDAVHFYDVLSESGSEIYLYSDTSKRLYRIDVMGQQIFMAANGGAMNYYSSITGISGVSSNPPSIPTPGMLSQSEIRACLISGGRIEKAGYMGAERCTRPYADGGKACTDSSQCQGQCRTDTNSANSSSIVGVCQMDDNPFGCFAEVKNGRTEPALCVD